MTSLGSEALPARLFKAIPRLRDALVAAGEEGRVVLPAEASEATDGAVPARGLGKALEVISADCARRGEPDLAALVVRESALVDGSDTGGGGRRRVWMHFGGQDAVDAGGEAEQAVVDRLTRTAGAPRTSSSRSAAAGSARAASAGAGGSGGAAAKAPRTSRASTAKRPAAAPPAPPSICPDCFTVRSASGSCLCV